MSIRIFIVLVTILCSCKPRTNSSEVKIESSAYLNQKDHGLFVAAESLIGIHSLDNVKRIVAKITKSDVHDPTFNITFDLFRCSAESAAAAVLAGNAKTELLIPYIELVVIVIDVLTSMVTSLSQSDPSEAGLGGTSILGLFRAGISGFIAVVHQQMATGRNFLSSGTIGARELLRKSAEMAMKQLSAAKVDAGLIQKVISPELYKHWDDALLKLGSRQTPDTLARQVGKSSLINVGFILARCTIALGKGGWQVLKELKGGFDDVVYWAKTYQQLDRACPNYNDFMQCQKNCGSGRGVNGQIFSSYDITGSCDRLPETKNVARGHYLSSITEGCYELHCKNMAVMEESKNGLCKIKSGTKLSSYYYAGMEPSVFFNRCCHADTYNLEQCGRLLIHQDSSVVIDPNSSN